VFFTFGTLGLLVSVLSAGKMPLPIGFAWAVYSGGLAVCYVLVIARRPALFPMLVGAQLVANIGFSMLGGWVIARGWLRSTPEHSALLIWVISAIVCIVLGYIFFLAFIQTEGRQTIRAYAELAMAHSIQQTLVPRIDLTAAGCQIFGISVPSDKVGGDVVDAVVFIDGGVTAYVADVAGHGLQAGILMGMVKTAARTRLQGQPGPAALFDSLNRVMPEVKEAHMYATCAALHIPPRSGDGDRHLELAIAGHPPVLRINGVTGKADYFFDEQLPLGLFPVIAYRSQPVACCSGDLFVIAPDGVLEVERVSGEEFGAERLEALVRSELHTNLAALAAKILESVNSFGKQIDDQTLLLIRVL
jgi:serine phosphatase RsbU (regulator of sigma subunit)